MQSTLIFRKSLGFGRTGAFGSDPQIRRDPLDRTPHPRSWWDLFGIRVIR